MSVPTNEQPTQPPATSDGTDTDSREELTVQIELLRERNRQLREGVSAFNNRRTVTRRLGCSASV